MRPASHSPLPFRLLTIAAYLLVATTMVAIVAGFHAYFPPDFDAEFLLGRERYFWNGYHVAFFTHIVAGPLSLVLGAIVASERARTAAPRLHRWLGRVQIALLVFGVGPSGLVMAWHAMASDAATWLAAATGLALLGVLTIGFALAGWRAATSRRFDDHRRWMWRTQLLLYSAVVLRMFGGASEVMGVTSPWQYPVAVWLSWLAPLATYELVRRTS